MASELDDKITPMTLIDDLCLSARSANVLRYNYPEVRTVWQLAELDPREILRQPNCGRKSITEMEEVLSQCGLRFMHHSKGSVFRGNVEFADNPWYAFCL